MQRWVLRSDLSAMYVTDVSEGMSLIIFQTRVLRTVTVHLKPTVCQTAHAAGALLGALEPLASHVGCL
jgi:hypothetical protein